jgi:hypothetical protein
MKRAVKLFCIEERRPDSPVVERVWRARSGARGEPAEAFISVALPHWQLVVRRERGRTHVSVRGPETKATTSLIPPETEFLGIDFKLGSFTPALPVPRLVDGMITLGRTSASEVAQSRS